MQSQSSYYPKPPLIDHVLPRQATQVQGRTTYLPRTIPKSVADECETQELLKRHMKETLARLKTFSSFNVDGERDALESWFLREKEQELEEKKSQLQGVFAQWKQEALPYELAGASSAEAYYRGIEREVCDARSWAESCIENCNKSIKANSDIAESKYAEWKRWQTTQKDQPVAVGAAAQARAEEEKEVYWEAARLDVACKHIELEKDLADERIVIYSEMLAWAEEQRQALEDVLEDDPEPKKPKKKGKTTKKKGRAAM